MGGGPINRDKLWFYVTYRQVGSNNTVPGMWVNKNANNPNLWVVDFDLSQPAFTDSLDRHDVARLTWQASRRNKLTFYWQEQYNYIGAEGGGTPTQTPDGHGLDPVSSRPASNRPPGRFRSTPGCWRRRGSGPTRARTRRAAGADRASAASAASTTR